MITEVLVIYFENEITPQEIPLFRGAIINSIDSDSLLFHNHTELGVRYGYPLIQYKSIAGRAVIVCIEKGVDDVQALFTRSNLNLRLGKRTIDCHIAGISPRQIDVGISHAPHNYRIDRWCCLNETNFKTFTLLTGIAERAEMLERILVGNILSFAKGLGMTVTEEIKVKITKLDDLYYLRAKGVPMACVDIEFSSNFVLPELIGLGKHSSINFGVVTEID